MTPAEAATILRQFNEWRREPLGTLPTPDVSRIGEAIDAAIEFIERAESDLATAEQDSRQKQARIERMTNRLRLILEEPENTMSNSKAMREMLRQARLALEESK